MTRPRLLLDARKAPDFGIGSYIVGLLGALARRGDLDLFAVVGKRDAGLLPAGVMPVLSEAPHYSLTELVAVRAALRSVRPDLFHAPHYVLPLFPPPRTVVTVHDLMHLHRPEHAAPARRFYAGLMIRRAVRLSTRIIAVSRATALELEHFDARAAGKTTVIPDGVDSAFLSEIPAAERERVRRAHGLSAPYVIFLGNDRPHKNLTGLLQAFALYRASAADPCLLVLAGTSAERAAERRRALEARGLTGAVRDLGVVPAADVPPLVAGAEALVLPSLAEGFGIPVLEAQAAGTPVICADRGGLPEAAGGAALLVDPERPEAIAGALGRLLTDGSLGLRLAAEGRAHAAAFTWDAVAERTRKVYEQVLAVP